MQQITFKDLMTAAPSIVKLSVADLPSTKAYKIHILTTALQSDIDFFQNQRSKKNTDLDELLEQCIETKVEKIRLLLTEDIKLSASDMAALMPFFDFEFKE